MDAYLSIEKGGTTSRFPLDPHRKTTIGRLDDCTLQLRESKISSRHCSIEMHGNYFFITDLNSTNGTYVNGSKIRIRQLFNGDEIRLGGILLRFFWEPSEESDQDITDVDVLDEKAKAKPKPPVPIQEEQYKVLGQYKIIEKIGQGGIGNVYRAETMASPPMVVAIKILNAKNRDHKVMIERFIREARALIALDHPRIIKVFELKNHEGCPYFSMEYIKGLPLNRFVSKNGPLPYRHALKIAGHIALALEYTHDNNIIHRDLKPGNILLEDGTYQVKLIDLGLAKMLEETDITVNRQLIGTPRYMAPEQMRDSREVDVRADVYSLGATLYHLISGIPPYTEIITNNKGALLKYIYSKNPVPINELVEDVPREVVALVERAMAKEKKRRFARAKDMFEEIYNTVYRLKK